MAAAMAKIEAQETAEMAEMAAKDAHVVDYVNPEQVFTSFTSTTFEKDSNLGIFGFHFHPVARQGTSH